MKNFLKRRSQKAGLPPGTPVYVGDKKPTPVKICLMDYHDDKFVEKDIDLNNLSICKDYINKASMTWINVEGLSDINALESLGKMFGLHPLVLEDIANTDQRPKLEDFDDYIYIVLKMFHFNEKTNEVTPEQVSIVFGKNYVITFQEGIEGDSFNSIRDRIRNGKGKITKMNSDYLVYAMVDSIIDTYFIILEQFGDKIENLELELINNPQKATLTTIYELKREMLFLRKSVWPLREVIGRMERGDTDLISEDIHIFLRDVYDHTINTLDTVETYRDMLSGMLDIYLSSISNRLNETMKYLALISTIFIPMTFISSIYGMNFEDMPELHWATGYPFALGLMVAIGLGFFIYFKKKRWV